MNPYLNLENFLTDGRWLEAYRETKTLILEEAKTLSPFLKTRQQSHLYIEDVLDFSSAVLAHLDHLWLEHSYGKFGFSVQKSIYLEVGGTNRFDSAVWEAFCDRVGWPYLLARESDLIFSLEAPDGHLPGFLDTSLVAFDSYDGFMYSLSQGKTVTGSRSLVSDFFTRTCSDLGT